MGMLFLAGTEQWFIITGHLLDVPTSPVHAAWGNSRASQGFLANSFANISWMLYLLSSSELSLPQRSLHMVTLFGGFLARGNWEDLLNAGWCRESPRKPTRSHLHGTLQRIQLLSVIQCDSVDAYSLILSPPPHPLHHLHPHPTAAAASP